MCHWLCQCDGHTGGTGHAVHSELSPALASQWHTNWLQTGRGLLVLIWAQFKLRLPGFHPATGFVEGVDR